MKRKILFAAVFALSACASVDMYTTGSSVLLDERTRYEPTTQVELLTDTPSRAYHEIAIVEAKGTHAAGMPDLMERLRLEARKVGAHAVIPSQTETQQTPQGLMYNPWLGGYQTVGGVRNTILRGVGIRYED